MDVWVIESGEYEQRSVYGVAESIAAAAAFVRKFYVSETRPIRWDEPVRTYDDDSYSMTGHVDGIGPIEHDFTRYDLQTTDAIIAKRDKRIATLEQTLQRVWLLSMQGQAEIDNGEPNEANKKLIEIAETAAAAVDQN